MEFAALLAEILSGYRIPPQHRSSVTAADLTAPAPIQKRSSTSVATCRVEAGPSPKSRGNRGEGGTSCRRRVRVSALIELEPDRLRALADRTWRGASSWEPDVRDGVALRSAINNCANAMSGIDVPSPTPELPTERCARVSEFWTST